MRINKYLAECNISSRRKVEEYVKMGMIKVNDKVVTNLSTNISLTDVVKFNDIIVKPKADKVYLLLNKPKGYISTVKDEKNRPTVISLIGNINYRIYPVGRLDCDTEGMLILTNDGDFANKLIHPNKEINKVYEVELNEKPNLCQLKTIENGVEIEDYITKPAKLSKMKCLENGKYSLSITIHEGKNRQVRKMFEAVGLRVINLKRVKIGSLPLGSLPVGKYKKLNKTEIELLLKN